MKKENTLGQSFHSSISAVMLFIILVALGNLPQALAQGVPIELTGLPTSPMPPRPVPFIVQKWAAAWNADDAKGMAALFTADGIYEDFAFQIKSQGRDGVAQWVEITARSIPDARLEVIDAFQMGDRVAVKWIFNGTPTAIGSVASTGKSFAVPAVSFFELKGKHIKRVGDYYNLADVLRQLGLPADTWTPPVPSTAATVYSEDNYGGKAVSLAPGSYTAAQLAAKGISNNSISSLKVSQGYEALMYDEDNFQGQLLQTFSVNRPCLQAPEFDNKTSSLELRKIGPPFVRLISPAPNTVFTAPATITLTAQGNDRAMGGYIKQVEFYNGTTRVGLDTLFSAGERFSFTWSNVAAGKYTLTAKAATFDGRTAVSKPLTIEVKNANNPPQTSRLATSSTEGSGLLLSPNPANHTVRLTGITAFPATIRIYDVKGVEVKRLVVAQPHEFLSLDLQALSGGTYVVRVVNKAGVQTQRLVKH